MKLWTYRFDDAHYFCVSIAIGDAVKIVQVVLDTEEWSAAHGFGFDNFLGSIQRLLSTLAVGTCLFDVSVFLVGAYGRLRRRRNDGRRYAFAISQVSGRRFGCLLRLGLGFCKTLHRERPNTNGASNMAASVLLLLKENGHRRRLVLADRYRRRHRCCWVGCWRRRKTTPAEWRRLHSSPLCQGGSCSYGSDLFPPFQSSPPVYLRFTQTLLILNKFGGIFLLLFEESVFRRKNNNNIRADSPMLPTCTMRVALNSEALALSTKRSLA